MTPLKLADRRGEALTSFNGYLSGEPSILRCNANRHPQSFLSAEPSFSNSLGVVKT